HGIYVRAKLRRDRLHRGRRTVLGRSYACETGGQPENGQRRNETPRHGARDPRAHGITLAGEGGTALSLVCPGWHETMTIQPSCWKPWLLAACRVPTWEGVGRTTQG